MREPRPVAPLMPAGYGVPTDGSGGERLPWSWAVERLESARNYWICTTRPDGRPHAAPVWGLWLEASLAGASSRADGLRPPARLQRPVEPMTETVPLWGAVWFATARDSLKGRNLARSPAFVLHLESGDETVILEGEAVAVRDRDDLERFADAYLPKYGVRPDPADPANVVYALAPAVALTWEERDFPGTATRWLFD